MASTDSFSRWERVDEVISANSTSPSRGVRRVRTSRRPPAASIAQECKNASLVTSELGSGRRVRVESDVGAPRRPEASLDGDLSNTLGRHSPATVPVDTLCDLLGQKREHPSNKPFAALITRLCHFGYRPDLVADADNQFVSRDGGLRPRFTHKFQTHVIPKADVTSTKPPNGLPSTPLNAQPL